MNAVAPRRVRRSRAGRRRDAALPRSVFSRLGTRSGLPSAGPHWCTRAALRQPQLPYSLGRGSTSTLIARAGSPAVRNRRVRGLLHEAAGAAALAVGAALPASAAVPAEAALAVGIAPPAGAVAS